MNAGALGRRALPRPVPAAEPQPPVLDLATVYEAYFRYVWRCLRSLGVRDSQLEDALQDVFIVVQRRLSEFDGRAAVRTWLYAIALRVARKYRERARRDPASLDAAREQDPEIYAASEASGDREHENERLLLARRALASLDDDKREIFVLARVEQMSAPEIASILRVPLNTVYSRLRAARLAFEAEIARLRGSPRSMP
ncbi:MAG TPA: sigma-70 family RNA polymerase sigma factor [Polyangiaceae bacterium]|nr:sigma-70 family RNA polymerase sigma factor [Polyangiaceae bacterium]